MKSNGINLTADKEVIINNKYILKKKLGSGSFGIVYLALNKINNQNVAVKMEKNLDKDNCSVLYEAAILNKLKGIKGIPEVYWSGTYEKYDCMAIPLLGKDLGAYVKLLRNLPLKTVLTLVIQILNIIQEMHNRGIIHRDLKPENLAMGREDEINQVYLIDFGIAKSIKDSQGKHIAFKEKKPFIGTCRYASIAAHKGKEVGRKDELESLGFVFLYFLKGTLPWQSIKVSDKERNQRVGENKEATDLEVLCKDLPKEIMSYFNIIRGYTFFDDPDYEKLKDVMFECASLSNIKIDNVVEWSQTYLKPKAKTDKRPSIQMPLTPKGLEIGNGGKEKFSSVNYLYPPDQLNTKSYSNQNDPSIASNSKTSLSQQQSIQIMNKTGIMKYEVEEGEKQFFSKETINLVNHPRDSEYGEGLSVSTAMSLLSASVGKIKLLPK